MKGMMVTREQNVGKNDSIGNKKKYSRYDNR